MASSNDRSFVMAIGKRADGCWLLRDANADTLVVYRKDRALASDSRAYRAGLSASGQLVDVDLRVAARKEIAMKVYVSLPMRI